MLAGISFEQSPKIRTACRQYHLVCCKRASIACESNIHKILLIFQMSKWRQYRSVEVVPPQRILLLWGGVAPHWAKRGGNLYANGWAVRWRSGPRTTVFTLCFAHLSPVFFGGDFDNLINSIFGPGVEHADYEKVSGFP